MSDIELNKFVPAEVQLDSMLLFFAKRNSGGSTLTEDFVDKMKLKLKCTSVVVFGNSQSAAFYNRVLPSATVYDTLEPDKLDAILSEQREQKDRNLEQTPKIIILDNCGSLKAISKWASFQCLVNNGRHLQIGVWIMTQSFLDVPRYVCSNADYVFTLWDNVDYNQKKLWETFFKSVPTFQQFKEIFTFYTKTYGVLCLDNKERSENMYKALSWYKSTLYDSQYVSNEL